MLIVDSQVPICGANTPERPWPARAHAHRETPVGHEEMLREMDAAGVHRAIIGPPSWEGDRNDLAISLRGCQSRLEPGHPSEVKPGKRPRLTLIPAMAFKDGKLFMTFGTPGASFAGMTVTGALFCSPLVDSSGCPPHNAGTFRRGTA